MEKWSSAQIELFHALGKICEKVGQEGVTELVRGTGGGGSGINGADGGLFLGELEKLRGKAEMCDALQKENEKLKADLDRVLKRWLGDGMGDEVATVRNENGLGNEICMEDENDKRALVDALRKDNRRLMANLDVVLAKWLSDGSATEGAKMRNENWETWLVEVLQRENKRLNSHLDMALEACLGEDCTKRMTAMENESTRSTSPLFDKNVEQNLPDERGGGFGMTREHLIQKYKILLEGHKQLLLARETLAMKLRSSQKSTKEWVEYANALEKRIDKLENKLSQHGIPLKHRRDATKTTVGGLSSAGDAAPIPTSRSELQQGRVENHDTGLYLDETRLGNRLEYCPLERIFPAGVSPRQDINAMAGLRPDLASHSSSSHYDSGRTEEDIEDRSDNLPHNHIGASCPIIKAEPSSDTPVILSCQSVKKRKRKSRNGGAQYEAAADIKIKAETNTSSPIGLAGLQNLIAQDSMDLDDIGEKMNTPKKRRQVVQSLGFENNSSASESLSTKPAQTVSLGEGESRRRPKRHQSILQPASPNKQILPRTSEKGKLPKRRRPEDQLMAAVILGEDGENYRKTRKPTAAEIKGGNPRELLPNLLQLDRRLTGLLEEPSPAKEILTPAKPSLFSATLARPQLRHQGITPSNKSQFSAGTSPSTAVILREAPKTEHKASMAKRRTFGTPKDVGVVNSDSTDQAPLRGRPLRHLGLEHFKVNPKFNQGSNYAFADVVRGRELRKCLPGCTKPECCGDKFRKLVELSMHHEKQTSSQEAENEKLLKDYLGDNRGRLRNMTTEEKEEILIQAKARELSNKASKHRHAYERRRSPPGFWRSDFPSTQELMSDRLEAANRERELVQQRYEEAMRPGGRWLFRDE